MKSGSNISVEHTVTNYRAEDWRQQVLPQCW